MNRIDDQLNRLFRAAAKVEAGAMPPPPFGLETRILAAWHTGSPRGFWDGALLKRGLVFALVIMGISLCPVLQKNTSSQANPFSEYLQLAASDTTSQFDNAP